MKVVNRLFEVLCKTISVTEIRQRVGGPSSILVPTKNPECFGQIGYGLIILATYLIIDSSLTLGMRSPSLIALILKNLPTPPKRFKRLIPSRGIELIDTYVN